MRPSNAFIPLAASLVGDAQAKKSRVGGGSYRSPHKHWSEPDGSFTKTWGGQGGHGGWHNTRTVGLEVDN
jgi:hypothetical protein